MKFPERLFVVTVGTTALGADRLGSLDDKGNSCELRECTQDFLSGTPPPSDLYNRVLKAHQDLWASVWPNGKPIWPYRYATSAEMVSSYYLLRVQVVDTLARKNTAPVLFNSSRDRILLLSSDTAQGKFCACINAQLMHDHLFEKRCDCGSHFGPDVWKCSNACVEVKVLKGLEGTQDGFKDIPSCLQEIWRCHAGPKTDIIINITGGYKGIIPALTYMSFRCAQDASLYYMHEEMKGAASIRIRGGMIECQRQDDPEFAN
ncbi:MAG TPA: hypothetical protein VKY85_07240 [Candidatus Angelobacter sp.]|nr:hypothetical protein [Candidatus Angelobacter sp.]